MNDLLDARAKSVAKELENLCRMELYWIGTQHREEYNSKRHEILKRLRDQCSPDEKGNSENHNSNSQNPNKDPAVNGPGDGPLPASKNARTTEYDAELETISYVAAYFDFSCRRFVDLVPMIVHTRLAFDFSKDLHDSLFDGLGITGEKGFKNCEKYLEEHHSLRYMRANLKARQEILDKSNEILKRVFENI